MGFPWSVGDQLNAADLNAVGTANLVSLIAGESIAAGAAVAAGYYQSDGGVQIDFISSFGVTGSSGNYSQPLNVGNNSNRLLYVVIVYRGNTASISSAPQFNGVSLTQIQNKNSYTHMNRMYAGYIVAPATGSHNLTWTATGAGSDIAALYVASLYQCSQTGQPDNSAFADDDGLSPGTVSTSITPSNAGDFVIAATASNLVTGGVLSWENNGTQTGTGANLYYGDANKTFPLRAIALSASGVGNAWILMIAVKPVTAATLGAVVNASASSSAGIYADNFSGYRSAAFLGFAVATTAAGAALNVFVGGIASGFSGLVAGTQYFLSNTGGAIATTAGSVSRKVAIAISATQVLITNIC